jgi:DNA-binding GntR family transcriptional regulator
LTRAYGVGRPTVRQAIDLLRRAGLVATVRGSGTFVVSNTNRISLFHFDGLTPSLRARGIEPSDTVVTAEAGRPPLHVLSVEDPPEGWWLVERVRSLPSHDGVRPFCVESDAFNLRYCPDVNPLLRNER